MSLPSQENSSFIESIMQHVRGFGLRIVVHISAFFCAGVVANFVPGYTAAAMYMGLICLVARDTRMSLPWLMPAGMGAVQVVLALALGLPFHEAIFWGGAQAWMQRLFMKRYAMGTEWGTVIFLFPLALKFCASSPYVLFTLASFGLLAALGGAFWPWHKKLEARKEAAAQAQERIKAAATSMTAGAHTEKSAHFAQKEDVFAEFKASIAKLRTKQLLLPKPLQPTLQALTKSAHAIIICMQEDARDKEPGEKFLRRYLPATHSVLDNYCRLAGSAKVNSDVTEDVEHALKHSIEIMHRLEQAFSQEHKSLLRNDIDDFSADLKVLDTLLKMEGK